MKQYQYVSGFRPRSKVTADEAGRELERIYNKYGALTAQHVFEESRPADAVLHDEFVWDGEQAIYELALIRSRTLIRSVAIVHKHDDGTVQASRVYAHVPDDPRNSHSPGAYERIDVLPHRPDQFERALAKCVRECNAARESLRELQRAASTLDGPDRDRAVVIDLAVQGFGAVREALETLRAMSRAS